MAQNSHFWACFGAQKGVLLESQKGCFWTTFGHIFDPYLDPYLDPSGDPQKPLILGLF